MFRRAALQLTTPALLVGAMWLWLALRSAGHGALPSTLGVATGASLLLYALEQVLPRPDLARRQPGTLLADLLFNAVTMVSAVIIPALVLLPAAAGLGRAIGLARLWPEALPTWLDVILCVLLVDFTTYWWHRLEHLSGDSWMWRVHSVHHSPKHFDVWMGARVHPVDVLVFGCVGYAFVAALGAPLWVVECTAFWASMVGAVHHTHVATDCGWLNRLIPMADHHAVHHSSAEHENGNFGNITTLFDQLFGSYLAPRPRDATPVGAWSLSPDYPQGDFVFQLLSPFGRYWQRAARKAVELA